MGIGPGARELYQLLDFRPPARICDLGSQDMNWTGSHEGSCREWLTAKGFDYTCIDMDGRNGAIVLDLNTATYADVLPFDAPRFEVVTNHGTSEHCFNQANVFKLMHDLTVVGGIMIHAVPTPDFGAPHGFYFYDETIFTDLAFANGYKMLQMFRRREPLEIILVAMGKTTDAPFKTPIQGMYRP